MTVIVFFLAVGPLECSFSLSVIEATTARVIAAVLEGVEQGEPNVQIKRGDPRKPSSALFGFSRWFVPAFIVISFFSLVSHDTRADDLKSTAPPGNDQIHVNWLYGSYVPKDVPLKPMNGDMRFKLYVRQTYTTWGIYVKTLFFATRDQVHGTYPEWGDGFEGYMKRFGSRQAQFIVQNTTTSLVTRWSAGNLGTIVVDAVDSGRGRATH